MNFLLNIKMDEGCYQVFACQLMHAHIAAGTLSLGEQVVDVHRLDIKTQQVTSLESTWFNGQRLAHYHPNGQPKASPA